MKLATYLLAVVLFLGFILLPASAQTNTTTTEATATTTTTTTATTATPSTVHRKHFTIRNVHYKVVRRIHVNKNKSG